MIKRVLHIKTWLFLIMTLFFLLLSSQVHSAPHKSPLEMIALDQSVESISKHLEVRGEDPDNFFAYQTDDDEIYTYSDDLFCVYSQLDSFSVHDPVTFGLASRLRNVLSIPGGYLQCMSIQ